jgi:membrane fusion protein (multidrug efflux system)
MNAPANDNAAPATTAPAGNPKRRTALTAIAVAVLVIGGGYGIYYWMTGRHSESTDNAYVQANVVQITAQAGGTVTAIDADDTDYVKAGQLLVKLDPADSRVALDQAEAALAQTVRETRILFANNSTLQAQIDARAADATRAAADLARAQDDVNRRVPLVQSGAVGKEEFDHSTQQLASYKSAYTAAKSALDAAREQLGSNQTQTEGTSVADHPNVQRAAAKVREAWLAVQRADVPAPVSGTVARRSVQATGNWIKVVQRVPVRISLDPKEIAQNPLRVGLSMNVTVDVADESGRSVSDTPRTQAQGAVASTTVFDALPHDADAEVARIVAANGGGRMKAQATAASQAASAPTASAAPGDKVAALTRHHHHKQS